MAKKIISSGLSFCLGVLSAGNALAEVQLKQQEGKVRIEIDGQHFSDYVFDGFSRPFLYPIMGPGGAKMTRNWPLSEAPNEERDHPHHKSFWWAHGAMNGVDFWAEAKESGKTVQESIVEVKSGKVGMLKTKNSYVAKDGKVICTDERTMRFHGGAKRMFDFEITLHASNGDLVLGDTKEGTMALRLAETMRLKGKVGKGHIVNSEGVRDGETWGKRAKWVDYYGPVDEKIVGVAMFDHPSNPRHPTWWHVRDYGLFAANPFGIHDFEKKPPGSGDLKIAAGEKITFKYRFYFHEGDEKAGDVSAAWDAYVKETRQ
jgi:hypothetical protein